MNAVVQHNLTRTQSSQNIFLYCILTLIVLFAFLPCLGAQFISLDDPDHLLKNPLIVGPFPLNAPTTLKLIFSQTINNSYIPLTTLSFAIEHHFWGMKPFIFHLNNLILHIINTLLVMALARRLGLTITAAFVTALIFGVHPVKVESVAWVTERKDVLYALFYILALHQYWSFLKKKSSGHYWGALFLGYLGILAKPMALSLPLILLLLDWFAGRRWGKNIIVEKIPFFLCSIGLGWLTYSLQMRNPVGDAGQAILIWIWTFNYYIWKFLFPIHFYAYYELPQPVSLTNWPYAVSFIMFLAIIAALIRWRENRFFVFALGYYFLSIFFILRFDAGFDISVVSDRYMYLPSLGICLWLGAQWNRFVQPKFNALTLAQFHWPRTLLIIVIVFAFGLLGIKTNRQCRVWQNSLIFWNELIRSYPDFFVGYINRGQVYFEEGKYDLALADYSNSISLNPSFPGGYANRGLVYALQGKNGQALQDFDKAITIDPLMALVFYNRSIVHEKTNNFPAALSDALRAKELGVDVPQYYWERLKKEAGPFTKTEENSSR